MLQRNFETFKSIGVFLAVYSSCVYLLCKNVYQKDIMIASWFFEAMVSGDYRIKEQTHFLTQNLP